MSISVIEATLVASVVEGILFGFYTALFSYAIYLLVIRNRRDGRFFRPIFLAGLVMYLLAFAHIVVSLIRTTLGFTRYDGTPEEETTYFSIAGRNSLYFASDVLYTVQVLIGDLFMVYRLYVVWYGDKRVVLPVVLFWIGDLITLIGGLHAEATASAAASIFTLVQWISAFFALTLITNGLCTVLIALKLWQAYRATSSYYKSGLQLNYVAMIILESGAMYSALLVSLLATFLSHTYAQHILADMSPQIVGVIFSLLIIRLHHQSATPSMHSSSSHPSVSLSNGNRNTYVAPLSPTFNNNHDDGKTHVTFSGARDRSSSWGESKMGLGHGATGRMSDLFAPVPAALTMKMASDMEGSDEYEMGESERGREPVLDMERGRTVQRVETPVAPLAVHVQVHTTTDAPASV